MADTRADITVQEGVWVDLYSSSGIAVGTAVDVFNKGNWPCLIAIKATAPASPTLGVPLYTGAIGSHLSISAGESGLWCYSPQGTTYVLVQEG
jgi:hypothetical protein